MPTCSTVSATAFVLGSVLPPLAAQAAWELAAPAQSPPARSDTALAIGPGGDLVLFGGDGASGPLADTWRWDGVAWTAVATVHGPPPSAQHALAWDAQRGRVVLFGGTGGAGTWEFDGSDWQPRATATVPPARRGHALAYDAARGRTVLFGGHDGQEPLSDTWDYDGADWRARAPAWRPPARSQHAMAYDARTQRTVLFGGRNASNALTYDTWQWDGAEWSLAWVYTNVPTPRCGHAMAFHPLRFRTVLFGDGFGLGTAHEWDGAQWWPAAGTVPSAQRVTGLGLAWHAATERIVAFGGASPGTGAPTQLTQQFRSLQPARLESFGSGCAGSAGVPVLSGVPWSLPWAGDFLDQRLDNVPGGSFTLLVFGWSRDALGTLPLPLELTPYGGQGCTAFVAPFCAAQLASAGPVHHRIFVPWRPEFTGVPFYEQAFLVGAGGANELGLAASNAMAIVFGWR